MIQKQKGATIIIIFGWGLRRANKAGGKGLLAALQIIHNLVDEDSYTLKMAPLRSDVEYA